MSDLEYQTKFDKAQQITWNGAYYTILDVREKGGVYEYRINLNGRKKWVSAPEVDSQAKLYELD